MRAWSENFNALSLDIDREGHSEYWLKGGRGSGKSVFIARKILLGMLDHPEASAIVYRKVAATLRQSVYEEFAKAIDALGLRPWCAFRLSPLEVRFRPTGQRILFRGADDPHKSKSITLAKGYFGYLWFEEAAEFAGMDDIRTIQASALRGHAAQKPITFLSYNPPVSVRNWINSEVLRPAEDRMVHHSSYRQLPREWIGEDFIRQAEALRASNERAWRHMYEGEVTGTGGQVFDNLQLRAITEDDIKALDRFYNGLDFGFANDPDALTRWAYSPASRMLYAVGEFVATHNTVDTLAERVKAMAGAEVVWCDSEDARTINELKRRGINAVGVKKGPGSVKAGIKWMQDLAAIVIDPARTPNIAREFGGYEYTPDRNGGFLPDVPDADNHTIDSGRYALCQQIMQKIARTRSDM